jgi:uncharacterized membrane protein YjfL (UPF0719 family)
MTKLIAIIATLSPLSLWAQGAATAPELKWHQTDSLIGGIVLTLMFSLIGIAISIIGYKLFDHFTPGDLHKEIVENKNIAAAIIGAAVIIGVSIIVAASILG